MHVYFQIIWMLIYKGWYNDAQRIHVSQPTVCFSDGFTPPLKHSTQWLESWRRWEIVFIMSCLAVKDPRLAGYLVLQMDGSWEIVLGGGWMAEFWGDILWNVLIASCFRFGVGFFMHKCFAGVFESEKSTLDVACWLSRGCLFGSVSNSRSYGTFWVESSNPWKKYGKNGCFHKNVIVVKPVQLLCFPYQIPVETSNWSWIRSHGSI